MEENNITSFDMVVADKVYQKCIDCGITKYTEIAQIIDTSDSFVKAIMSEKRKKFNLYHLVRLSYALHCYIDDFLPTQEDYEKINNEQLSKEEHFIKLIGGKNE